MSDPNLPADFQAPPPPPLSATPPPAPRPTGLRIPAIILFVLGIAVLVGGIAKLIAGGIQGGGALAVLGAMVFGFSFIPLPRPGKDPSQPIPLLERIAGVFYEPSRIFKNLGEHPRWVAAFLIICALNIAYGVAFRTRLTPQRIVSTVTERMAQTPFIPPEAVEQAKVDQLEELTNPVRQVLAGVKSIVGQFIYYAFLAALFLLGVLVLGGRINYWQAFVVAIYAALPIVIVQRVLSLVLLYIKDPDEIHPILGQETLVQDNLSILFSSADRPILFVLASAIGILSFYSVWLRATGLQNAGTKVTSTAAWGTAITIWVLGLVVAAIFTAIFPAFIA